MLAMRYSEGLGTICHLEDVFLSCHPYHTLITPIHKLPAKLDLPSSIHPTTHPHSLATMLAREIYVQSQLGLGGKDSHLEI